MNDSQGGKTVLVPLPFALWPPSQPLNAGGGAAELEILTFFLAFAGTGGVAISTIWIGDEESSMIS